MSQKSDILEHLQKGNTISRLEALNTFGCFELRARICELQDEGHKIHTDYEMITKANGKKKQIAVYSLKVPMDLYPDRMPHHTDVL